MAVVPSRSFRLSGNYRNTRQIAALAASIASGLATDDDGSLPDPATCRRDGPLPVLLRGKFSQQLAYVLARLSDIDLTRETAGFLHLKGGGWFDEIRQALISSGYDYCELQCATEWPSGPENIGLCTFHSAKGLEFDHVFIIGLARSHASYGTGLDDDRYDAHRRLIAMGIGRARQTVLLGTKPGEELPLLATIDTTAIQDVPL